MTTEPVIEFKDVGFSYDGASVLHDVTFTLFAHESVCIVGPNGGGKTTLLKLILGLRQPRTGSVRVLNRPPSESCRRIGYMPQFADFDPAFPISVMSIVLMGRLGRGRFGFYSRLDKHAALNALEEMAVADLADRPFAALSGGQRQRVLIARALTCEPDLLLLDEPTAHVDPAMEWQIHETLSRLARRMTVITVSHELGFVSQMVDRVLCVNHTTKIHPTSEISGEIIKEIYGSDLKMVRHDHQCSGKGHRHG